MLFDLRARGRRRTVQGIYLMLAVLMGGGLVLFGIGGATSGGLVDAITGGGGGGGGGGASMQKRVDQAQKQVRTAPADKAAWAALARAEYQLAGTGENFDQTTNTFTAKGRRQLSVADRAWQHYLSLNPKSPDGDVASLMVQAYGQDGLNQPVKAVAAQEIVIDNQPASSGLYANLAVLAYEAGQDRKGDLATAKALSLASKSQRPVLKQTLQQAKTAAANPSGGTQSGGASAG
jgi:hypothetical protein